MYSEEEPGIPSSKGEKEMLYNTWNILKNAKETPLRHVVDVKCTVAKTLNATDVCPDDPRDSQSHRTLIFKSYRRLEDIGSAVRFHTVFVDAVRAHHCMYEASKILHGDIGVNNIMWCEGRDGQPVGVLCDWDLAEGHTDGDVKAARPELRDTAGDQLCSSNLSAQRSMDLCMEQSTVRHAGQSTGQALNPIDVASPDEKPETPMPKPRYRTGTGPFMALDLLRPGPPPLHKYRHDLESFFYIYITFAAAYDPPKRYLGKIMQWQQESLVAIGDEKHDFLLEMHTVDQILNPKLVHDEFKPLLDQSSFLMALHEAFGTIETLASQVDHSVYQRTKAIRRGLPTDKFDAQIMKVEKERDKQMTYSKFMEILTEPEDIK
ncbi:hypothetical protein DAEQUDRAFT_733908 [Daedalea quercina L-15889]|uniref:Fungal-type protein kinase domain-containing protein n=1 Tax=Daedalea quercina L-15889 TaxID=1314783 RepID=A0A165KNI6_9APHY|nr:hypothetical protein DAEQUDRAFT_733908 [Daedalea quercina L-15889]